MRVESTGDLEVHRNLAIPAAELRERASRSSGPGGQHVNKSNTRVSLLWNIRDSAVLSDTQRRRLLTRLAPRLARNGELAVHAGRSRSRERNRLQARARLAELVRDALASRRARIATRAGRGVRERTLADKRHRGAVKQRRRRGYPDDDA